MTRRHRLPTAEHPRDPAGLLRTLRDWRSTVIKVAAEAKQFGAFGTAMEELRAGIDKVAGVLTGDSEYFWARGGGPTAEERAHGAKWRRIESREEPWPK